MLQRKEASVEEMAGIGSQKRGRKLRIVCARRWALNIEKGIALEILSSPCHSTKFDAFSYCSDTGSQCKNRHHGMGPGNISEVQVDFFCY